MDFICLDFHVSCSALMKKSLVGVYWRDMKKRLGSDFGHFLWANRGRGPHLETGATNRMNTVTTEFIIQILRCHTHGTTINISPNS